MKDHETINVMVHYPASTQPFKEAAEPGETVRQLKARALSAFGLADGQGQDGNQIVYMLYFGKRLLEDMSVTLGQLAGDKHELQLKLSQQMIQGRA